MRIANDEEIHSQFDNAGLRAEFPRHSHSQTCRVRILSWHYLVIRNSQFNSGPGFDMKVVLRIIVSTVTRT